MVEKIASGEKLSEMLELEKPKITKEYVSSVLKGEDIKSNPNLFGSTASTGSDLKLP